MVSYNLSGKPINIAGRHYKNPVSVNMDQGYSYTYSQETLTTNEAVKEMPVAETGAKREKLYSVRYDYLPMKDVAEAYCKIADFGAKKYDVDNWKKGLPMSQVAASLQRHLWAFLEGEDNDQESGLNHLDHVLWNAVALVYYKNRNMMDDRFKERLKK